MSKLYNDQIIPISNKMYRYALSILKDEQSSYDVTQECLTKIWERKNKLSDIQNIEAWAMRIIRNQCFDWVKTSNKVEVLPETHDEQETVNADHELLLADSKKWLELILDNIPGIQKEIFHLREIEGLSYHEISEVLTININEVKVYLHRARTKIRASMTKIDTYGIAN